MWSFKKRKPKRVYLDYAAATPLHPKVGKAMAPYWRMYFANSSAIHTEGVRVRKVVEDARTQVARTLGVRSEGVIFTGSGTESNNIAIGGVLEARHKQGTPYRDMEVLVTAIEHPSVSEVLKTYEHRGVTVKVMPVDDTGRVEIGEVPKMLSVRTVLVTLGYVNSEIGTIQPVNAVARSVRAFEKEHGTRIICHTDAAQAPLWLSCQLSALGVDMLSLDAGKCHGPKGVGVLAMRQGVQLEPILFGGGQESGLRPGTENVPLIIGAASAIEHAQINHKVLSQRVTKLRDRCIHACLALEDVVLNGHTKERVANNVNISVGGVEAEFAVISLDAAGFAIATKSACSTGDGGGSEVVRAICGDTNRSQTSLRITLGPSTTAAEIDAFVKALSEHIKRTRKVVQEYFTKVS